MSLAAGELTIEEDAPISTWFHVGGRAQRLARPTNTDQLGACLELDDELMMLGEGANLLVHDDGVSNLVVSLQQGRFIEVEIDPSTGWVRAGAGASLPRLITASVKAGLGGLEGLAGIPATIGGACVMNAGGTFGEIGSRVLKVRAMDRAGRIHELERAAIDFSYRHSGLNHLMILDVEFGLTRGDEHALRDRLTECMLKKTGSQPMKDKSAGCAFKNPTLTEPIDGIGESGDRVSAGMLIDRAGCKGISVGGASVSDVHANFIVTTHDARAQHVIELMREVQRRVHDRFGVQLDREVVVWGESHP